MLSDRKLDHEGQILIGKLCLWMVFRSERDVGVRQLHSFPRLDVLSQANLSLSLTSFFPYVFEVMDMLLPKITFISSS
jgi:hypothetical protein